MSRGRCPPRAARPGPLDFRSPATRLKKGDPAVTPDRPQPNHEKSRAAPVGPGTTPTQEDVGKEPTKCLFANRVPEFSLYRPASQIVAQSKAALLCSRRLWQFPRQCIDR